MKQKDITLIIVVAIVSVVVGLVASSLLFGSPTQRQQEAEVVEAITAEFPAADKRYFNETSVDPTETIRIGDAPNQAPFGQGQ